MNIENLEDKAALERDLLESQLRATPSKNLEDYEVQGPFQVPISNTTQVQMRTEALNSTEKPRYDKTVVIQTPEGQTKKVSSIMMGYNKQGIHLADGSFVSSDELLTAMKRAVSSLEKGSIVVNQKGQYLYPEALLELVGEASGKLIVGDRFSKVVNQDSRKWSIQGSEGKKVDKGVVFLGNSGLQLESGEYVSSEEFLRALSGYVIMKPKTTVLPPKQPPRKEDGQVTATPQVVRVSRKYTNKASKILALLAATLVLTSGFRMADNVKEIQLPVNIQKEITTIVEEQQLVYQIDGYEYTYESETGAIERAISEVTMGGTLSTREGQSLNTNSLLSGVSKTFGVEFDKEGKQAGDYRVTGFSIVHDGKIIAALEDFNALDNTTNLGDYINQALEKSGLTMDDIQIRVHVGSNQDYTRAGWGDITDFINADTITDDMLQRVAQEVSCASGTIDNFEGNSIEIMDGVTIQVVDNFGNLLPAGSHVIGSDGQEYIINQISLESQEKEKTQTISYESNETVQVKEGKKLVWNIQNCSLMVGVLPALAAVGLAVANKKKNEEAQKNPSFFEFETETEYQKFKSDFEKAKEKYDQQSGFKGMLKRVLYRSEKDLLQDLDELQIQQIYTVIKNHAGVDFPFSNEDKISLKNGRIFILYSNGSSKDITDIVKSEIAFIGKDNPVQAEGRLMEEQEHGIRSK